MIYTLCLKKVPTFELSVTLSNLNRFSKFLNCWKAYEFATQHLRQYPPHLKYVTALPWEIKKSIFANIQQIWKKMQTNFDICISIWESVADVLCNWSELQRDEWYSIINSTPLCCWLTVVRWYLSHKTHDTALWSLPVCCCRQCVRTMAWYDRTKERVCWLKTLEQLICVL